MCPDARRMVTMMIILTLVSFVYVLLRLVAWRIGSSPASHACVRNPDHDGALEPTPYLISLPRHRARREHLTAQGIEFLWRDDQVVDGSRLKKKQLLGLLSPRAFYDYHMRRCDHRTIVTMGAVGCYLSHENAWKHVLEQDVPCMILEDDVIISRADWRELASHWLRVQKKEAWIFFIGHMTMRQARPLSYGAHAYIINPRAAQELLHASRPIEMHVDLYLRTCAYAKGWHTEYAKPTAFRQLERSSGTFKSSTQANEMNNSAPRNVYSM